MHILIGIMFTIGFISAMCMFKTFRYISLIVIGIVISVSIANMQETNNRMTKFKNECEEFYKGTQKHVTLDGKTYTGSYAASLCNH